MDEEKLRKFFTISRGLSERDREALVLRAVDYVRRYDPHFTWNIIKAIEKQTIKEGEVIMTPLLQSSLEEARQEGRQEVIFNMLKAKAELSFISEITGLSEEEIKRLQINNDG